MPRVKKPENLRKQIKADLLSKLQANKTTDSQYMNLVDDYMSLWEIKNLLIADINVRGVNIYWSNGGGQEGLKKNESISEMVRVNAQMLKILAELGLRATEIKVDDGDERSDV